MTQTADIIVIGGGAAGLMAAAGAASGGASVIVLEKMPRPGRKIMITGKGRCNFTNLKAWNEFNQHIHPKPNFLKPSFYNLSSEKMIEFLEFNGMESVVERGDRAFPASHLASDVVDALVRAAECAGAEIECGKEVKSVTSGEAFVVTCTDKSIYTCSKLIICTGGLSYPKTGSTGDGYRWASELGHSIRPLFPSLTAIVPMGYKACGSIAPKATGHIDRSNPLSETGRLLCGNQLKNIQLTIIIDGNTAQEEFGDMDFTDGGIEGPVGFKVSRKCVNAIMNGSKVQAILDLKPAVDLEDLTVRINTLWNEVSKDKRNANKLYKDRFKILLTKVLPMSLIQGFVKLNPNADHKTLAKTLKNWKFEIEGYVGYERCVITAGGVSCEEVAPKTLESKLTPGLYFAGEVLDLDADTGGYNLQTAFSTGYLAGISAAKSLK
jgi:predicted Rossmann fold flavoprotein